MENGQLKVPYREARKIIEKTFEQYREEGVKSVDVVDVHLRTHLPVLQVGKVLQALEREGRIQPEEDDFDFD